MNYEIRPIAGQVRRHMDAELRALRSRDVWAYVTAVWPLLDRVLARWVAFVTPSMPLPGDTDTVLRESIRQLIMKSRGIRQRPENAFDSNDLYAAVVGTLVGMAPLISRVEAHLDDGSVWTPLSGPLALKTQFQIEPQFIWYPNSRIDEHLVYEAILEAITDELTRPLTARLSERIRNAA